MILNDYQKRTQATAKVFKPRAFPLNDLRGLIAVMEAATANTEVAGVLKKNIFHGHEKPFDVRNIQEMYMFAEKIKDKHVPIVGYTPFLQVPELALIDGILGMVDEVGEVAELVIPILKGEKTATEVAQKLQDEIGDVMWYLARTAESAGITLGDIAAGNLAKLEARYPSGFDPNASQNRDLENEDKAQKEAINNSSNKEDKLLEALLTVKKAMDCTIMGPEDKVALKGSAEDVKIIQDAYDLVAKTIQEAYND